MQARKTEVGRKAAETLKAFNGSIIASVTKEDCNKAILTYCKTFGIRYFKTAKGKDREVPFFVASAAQGHSQSFYDSPEWKKLRYAVLVKHGAKCQCCGATRKSGARIHVDHIKPRSKSPELALCADNLQVLCEDCNLGKSAWDDTDWR